jgi:hypothetical protein
MIFGNLFNKTTGTKNIELLTEVFVTAHNSICDSLTKNLNEVLANDAPTFKAASRFEVGMYLLFRLDQTMCDKQCMAVRRKLLCSCTDALLPSDDSHFVGIVDQRLKTYGEIFNDTKNSESTWADVCQRFHDYLVNAICYCNDKYEKMTTEIMPIVIVGIFKRFYLKQALISCELVLITMFCCVLKHIFSGNNNFLLLPKKEIIKRIKEGFQEGELIEKSVEENIQQNSSIKPAVSL